MIHPFRNRTQQAVTVAAALLLFAGSYVFAQTSAQTAPQTSPQADGAAAARASDVRTAFPGVRSLTRLPGTEANAEGTLYFHGKNLRFATGRDYTEIDRRRIIGVSSGDERIETGGKAGKIARVLIPYGGGLVLGTVTHKKVGLLTVEFTDDAGEYHGAVFVMSTEDIASAMAQLEAHPVPLLAIAPTTPRACPAPMVQPNTVRVEEIGADPDSQLPAEDRVLLYERLLQQLKSEKTVQDAYRASDRPMPNKCAEFTVTVRATAFHKGDQAVRASVGPLGHFVGTTKLSFHLTVSTPDGTTIIDQDLKKSEGSDSDSLNITKVIGKAVVKNLKKSRAELRKTQMV